MSKKKKRKSYFNPHKKDCHHLLWMARNYNNGWAKALRGHEYLKVMIPQMTLHREIHQLIPNIPPPDGKACHLAYETIERGLRDGNLDAEYDKIEARLDILIGIWEKQFPDTAKALRAQQQVVSNFYERER